MPDTKRGREKTGEDKEEFRRDQLIAKDIELLERSEEFPGLAFAGPMRAIYTADWDLDDPRTIECEGYVETDRGVILVGTDREPVGYVSHENLIAIEPVEKWAE